MIRPIPVEVRNDILPYKNWYVSRKEVRQTKENAFARLAERLNGFISAVESAQTAGELTSPEAERFDEIINSSLQRNMGSTIPYTSRIDRDTERLVMPYEPYLVFLAPSGETFELIEERFGFNLFFGLDALILIQSLENELQLLLVY